MFERVYICLELICAAINSICEFDVVCIHLVHFKCKMDMAVYSIIYVIADMKCDLVRDFV